MKKFNNVIIFKTKYNPRNNSVILENTTNINNISLPKINKLNKHENMRNKFINHSLKKFLTVERNLKKFDYTLTLPSHLNINIKNGIILDNPENNKNIITGKSDKDIKKYSKTILSEFTINNKAKIINKNKALDYYKAYKCIFCERIYKPSSISNEIKCNHKFCENCGKEFFEELLKVNKYEKYTKFKCPIEKCKAEISLDLIKKIIGEKNFEKLKESNEQSNLNKMFNLNEGIDSDDKNMSNSCNKFDLGYDSKHILEINSKKKFFKMKSNKLMSFCPQCNQNSVFRQTDRQICKCLNCMQKYCNLCMKKYDVFHFDLQNVDRCKVYYRKNKFNVKAKNYLKMYLIQLILISMGYIYLCSIFILEIKHVLRKNNKSKLKKIILFFSYITLFIIFFPFIIILLPYFPILLSF